jgi:uncharacterized protein (UPF0147 family)
MNCNDFELWMMDYLDNTLDEKKRAEIEKHLTSCNSCLDELKECQKLMLLSAGAEMQLPGESLRKNFSRMLGREIRLTGKWSLSANRWYNHKVFLAAAGLALLICGTFIGMLIGPKSRGADDTMRFDQLQAQVTEMRKENMLRMLGEESISHRLMGLSYTDDMASPDNTIIVALLNTLNSDSNVNVRLAAAYSLSKFTNDRMVCDSLVASLPRQNEPIIQVTLINILTEIREKSALKSIKHIIDDTKTMKEVRDIAERSTEKLML